LRSWRRDDVFIDGTPIDAVGRFVQVRCVPTMGGVWYLCATAPEDLPSDGRYPPALVGEWRLQSAGEPTGSLALAADGSFVERERDVTRTGTWGAAGDSVLLSTPPDLSSRTDCDEAPNLRVAVLDGTGQILTLAAERMSGRRFWRRRP
jgi:hypothetical protein